VVNYAIIREAWLEEYKSGYDEGSSDACAFEWGSYRCYRDPESEWLLSDTYKKTIR
jgi:hypothetical protein